MKKIYIAGPYTLGDVAVNVGDQIRAADVLMDHGFAPFWPLHAHFQHINFARPYEEWIAWGLEWVRGCDALLRLPGESKGADGEVALAVELGIPVYYDLESLLFLEKENPEYDKPVAWFEIK